MLLRCSSRNQTWASYCKHFEAAATAVVLAVALDTDRVYIFQILTPNMKSLSRATEDPTAKGQRLFAKIGNHCRSVS